MKISDLRKLVKIANRLDAAGYGRLADELDAIVREAAHDPSAPKKSVWDEFAETTHRRQFPRLYDDTSKYDSSAEYIANRPEPGLDPKDYCPIHTDVRLYRNVLGDRVCGECEWEARQRQKDAK